jgi:hypothetical protein
MLGITEQDVQLLTTDLEGLLARNMHALAFQLPKPKNDKVGT